MNPAATHCPMSESSVWRHVLYSVCWIFRPIGPCYRATPISPPSSLRQGFDRHAGRPYPGGNSPEWLVRQASRIYYRLLRAYYFSSETGLRNTNISHMGVTIEPVRISQWPFVLSTASPKDPWHKTLLAVDGGCPLAQSANPGAGRHQAR